MESKRVEALKEEVLKNQPYFGTILSCVSITEVPVGSMEFKMGIGIHPKFKNLLLFIREDVFSLPLEEQLFLMNHEIGHVFFSHMETPPSNDKREHQIINMAMDMCINQELSPTPVGPYVFPENYNLPRGLSTWEYYALLKKDSNLQPQEGHDSHDFGDPATAKELMEACKDTILKADALNKATGRTLSNKVFNEQKSILLGSTRRNATKEILRYLCKISLQSKDIEKTYNRESRRYRDFPGNVAKEQPRILFGIDTSGSISDELRADALGVVLNVAKSIGATVECVLWHTSVYSTFPITKLSDIQNVEVQSGGTNIADLIDYIKKSKPDLSVVMTDGIFTFVEPPKSSKIVWVLNAPCEGFPATRVVKGY